ncbi:hypothetical protein ACIGH6_14465 [Brachybacterium paraconglomeratum]|uniref:hypothetical protein n=1 Tax=Brachybacterium paraconglomeratum TaxID=173362 RepID=UPI0037C79575
MNTHPLSQLIQSIEDGRGWTDREVSRRIAAAGHKMSHSYIGKLKNHPIQSVNASMVQTLAIGLGIPETVVAEAALASMGVHIDTSSSAGLDVAIATDEALTDRDKRLLRSLVKEMRTDGEERRDDGPGSDHGPRVPSGPQPDGATTRTSEPRLTLVSDDVPDLRGLPFAADEEKPGDDPGEDDD